MQWLMAFPSQQEWANNVSQSGIVTVYLLLIVFAVLGLLVVLLTLGQKLMVALAKANQKRKSKKAHDATGTVPAAETAALPQAMECDEDDPQLVAAIMAAISVVMEKETHKKAKFVVRSIKRL